MIFEELYKLKNDYKCLFDILIDYSNGFDSYKFWLCEKDNKYFIVWCKLLNNFELTNLLHLYQQTITNFEDLKNDDNFIKYFNENITYYDIKLNEKQEQLFMKFYNTELNDDIQKPHGLDGYSYHIKYYKNNSIIERNCWCHIPNEWVELKQISIELFTMINLDKNLI